MVISVINWLIAARKAMISARSGSSGCTTGGSCNANSSNSPSNPARRSPVARRHSGERAVSGADGLGGQLQVDVPHAAGTVGQRPFQVPGAAAAGDDKAFAVRELGARFLGHRDAVQAGHLK